MCVSEPPSSSLGMKQVPLTWAFSEPLVGALQLVFFTSQAAPSSGRVQAPLDCLWGMEAPDSSSSGAQWVPLLCGPLAGARILCYSPKQLLRLLQEAQRVGLLSSLC